MSGLEGGDSEALDRYLKLLKAADGSHLTDLGRVFLELENGDRQSEMGDLAELVSTLGNPSLALEHHDWIRAEFQEEKQRDQARSVVGDLHGMGLEADRLKPTLERLMKSENPSRGRKHLQRLLDLNGDFSGALADLEVCTTRDRFRFVERVRRDHHGEHQALAQAADLIFQDPEKADSRRHAFLQLAGVEDTVADSLVDLKALLEGGDQDLEAAADHFTGLLREVPPDKRQEVRDNFVQVRGLKAAPGSTGWLSFLSFETTPEEAFSQLVELHGSPSQALADLAFLQEKEDQGSGLKKKLKDLVGLYYLEQGPSQSEVHAAYELLHQKDELFQGSSKKFKLLRLVAQDTGSLGVATRAVRGMTRQADQSEYQARLESFYQLLDESFESSEAAEYIEALGQAAEVSARPFFEAMMAPHLERNSLEPTAAMVELTRLLGPHQEAREAVTALAPLLSGSREVSSLTQLLGQAPAARAPVMKTLLQSYKQHRQQAFQDAGYILGRSKDGQAEDTLRAYAELVSVFEKPEPEVLRGHLDWALGLSSNKEYKRTPPARLLQELAQQLLVDPTSETARQNVLTTLGADTLIEEEEDFIIVGDFVLEKNHD